MMSGICTIFVREHLWFGLQTRLSVPFIHSTAHHGSPYLGPQLAIFFGDPADWIQTQHSSSTRTTHFLGDANIQLPSQTRLSCLPVSSFWSFSWFYIELHQLTSSCTFEPCFLQQFGSSRSPWMISLFPFSLFVSNDCGECFSLSTQDCVSEFTPWVRFSQFSCLSLLVSVLQPNLLLSVQCTDRHISLTKSCFPRFILLFCLDFYNSSTVLLQHFSETLSSMSGADCWFPGCSSHLVGVDLAVETGSFVVLSVALTLVRPPMLLKWL